MCKIITGQEAYDYIANVLGEIIVPNTKYKITSYNNQEISFTIIHN